MELPPPAPLASLHVAPERRFGQHQDAFLARFGGDPAGCRTFFAPGRVNLMGAHLDYNGGPVMPMAIDRGTFVTARPRSDGRLCLASTSETQQVELELRQLERDFPSASGSWWDYPLGVFRALDLAPRAGGLELLFGGDLPVGAGLSSSASITLATAVALDGLYGLGLDVQAGVDAALEAEREYVGVQCGIMDPYAVGLARPGHVLVLDCSDRSVEHVALDAGRYAVGIVDSGVRRELSRGEFNQRVLECSQAFEALGPFATGASCLSGVSVDVLDDHQAELAPTVARRARHVLEETARTLAARDALGHGDVPAFGAAMFAAHRSLRDLFEVSIPELDFLVELAAGQAGVLGARLTGAGFGGCVATILEVGTEQAFSEAVLAGYRAEYEHEPQVAFYRGSPGLGEVLAG